MEDGRRFEDKVEITDLIKDPNKILLAKIYQQVLKTNGTVTQNCKDITDLKVEMKDKIGWKIFVVLTSILGVVILIFNIIDRVLIN
jgi:hypothetical protein